MLSEMGIWRGFFPCGYLKKFMHKGDYEQIINSFINGRNIDCYYDDNLDIVIFRRNGHSQIISIDENTIVGNVLNKTLIPGMKEMQNIYNIQTNCNFTNHHFQNIRNTSSRQRKKSRKGQIMTEKSVTQLILNETAYQTTDSVKEESGMTTEFDQLQLPEWDEDEEKRSNSSSNFWFQLKILQFILVIFSLLYLFMKFAQKIANNFDSTNIIEPQNDNIRIIELEKHPTNTQNIYVTMS